MVLNDENAKPEQQRGTRRTLVRVLETTLRLLHPSMPFITEELWHQVKSLAAVEGDTIMNCAYPQSDKTKIDADAIDEMHWVQAVITGVRNIRGEMNISPSKELPIFLQNADAIAITYLNNNISYLTKFGRFESIQVLDPNEEAPESATALVGSTKVLIPLGSFIDAEAEIKRLQKELEKSEKEIAGVSGRLNNSAFVDKAPSQVIDKARAQLSEAESNKAALLEQIERMQAFVEA